MGSGCICVSNLRYVLLLLNITKWLLTLTIHVQNGNHEVDTKWLPILVGPQSTFTVDQPPVSRTIQRQQCHHIIQAQQQRMPPRAEGKGRRWQGLKTLMHFEPWPPVVRFLSLFSTVLIIFLQIIQGSTSDHHCGTTTTETDTTTGSNSSSSRDSEMRTSPW